MNDISDAACESALHFFGTMTASISHEINNILSIINENAGLLEDFTLMADKGIPLDPERIKVLAGKITAQIRRADMIVKNMNKFAHSVDEPVKRIDLIDLLGLVVALSNRLASIRCVTLEVDPPKNPIAITTNDFFLKNLLWLCLDFAMNAAGQDKTVVLNAEQAENNVLVRFTRLEGLKNAPRMDSPGFREGGLLVALKGELTIDIKAGEILLTLPSDVNQ